MYEWKNLSSKNSREIGPSHYESISKVHHNGFFDALVNISSLNNKPEKQLHYFELLVFCELIGVYRNSYFSLNGFIAKPMLINYISQMKSHV